MSDPYNSHGTMLPPVAAQPMAVRPAAGPSAAVARICRLQESDAWKEKFLLIEKAGGADLPHLRKLTSSERFAIQMNWWAFFFGAFYLLVMGLWRPAATIIVIGSAIFAGLEAMGWGGAGGGTAVGILCAMRANLLYYRRVVLDERPWI